MRHKLLGVASLVVAGHASLAQGTRTPIAARVTVVSESRDSTCWELAQSPANAKLLACTSSTNDLRVINTETHAAIVLVPGIYAGQPAWSRAGDRIVWQGEGDHIWSIAVDPRTGTRAGDARRISVGTGRAPSFSPNGKQIAFLRHIEDRKQSVMVMPADGGQETKLAECYSNGPLSWSPDGSALFYPSAPGSSAGRQAADVFRVAADGRSKPVRIVSLGDEIFRGMSPDGRFMVSGPHVDPTGWALGTVTLRDASGKVLGQAVTPRGAGDVSDNGDDWTLRPLQIVARREWKPRVLRSLNLATGESRELARSTDDLFMPNWSPDGRRISVQVLEGDRVVLALMNPDGSDRRILRTTAEPAFIPRVPRASGNAWSPDSRWLLYLAVTGRERQLHVVDVAANKDLTLVHGSVEIPAFHWLDNSRGVRYMKVEGTGNSARSSVHEVSLDGADRELRVLEAKGIMQFVGADWVLSGTAGTLERVSGGAARQLHASMPGFLAAVSSDGHQIAFLPNRMGSSTEPAQYDVVSVDNGTMQTVKLAPGLASTLPFFTSDGRSLLVPNANSGSNERTPTTPAQVLVVPIAGGASRVATTLPAQERFSGGILSPDGKTLLYVSDSPVQQKVLSLDLSGILSEPRDKKP